MASCLFATPASSLLLFLYVFNTASALPRSFPLTSSVIEANSLSTTLHWSNSSTQPPVFPTPTTPPTVSPSHDSSTGYAVQESVIDNSTDSSATDLSSAGYPNSNTSTPSSPVLTAKSLASTFIRVIIHSPTRAIPIPSPTQSSSSFIASHSSSSSRPRSSYSSSLSSITSSVTPTPGSTTIGPATSIATTSEASASTTTATTSSDSSNSASAGQIAGGAIGAVAGGALITALVTWCYRRRGRVASTTRKAGSRVFGHKYWQQSPPESRPLSGIKEVDVDDEQASSRPGGLFLSRETSYRRIRPNSPGLPTRAQTSIDTVLNQGSTDSSTDRPQRLTEAAISGIAAATAVSPISAMPSNVRYPRIHPVLAMRNELPYDPEGHDLYHVHLATMDDDISPIDYSPVSTPQLSADPCSSPTSDIVPFTLSPGMIRAASSNPRLSSTAADSEHGDVLSDLANASAAAEVESMPQLHLKHERHEAPTAPQLDSLVENTTDSGRYEQKRASQFTMLSDLTLFSHSTSTAPRFSLALDLPTLSPLSAELQSASPYFSSPELSIDSQANSQPNTSRSSHTPDLKPVVDAVRPATSLDMHTVTSNPQKGRASSLEVPTQSPSAKHRSRSFSINRESYQSLKKFSLFPSATTHTPKHTPTRSQESAKSYQSARSGMSRKSDMAKLDTETAFKVPRKSLSVSATERLEKRSLEQEREKKRGMESEQEQKSSMEEEEQKRSMEREKEVEIMAKRPLPALPPAGSRSRQGSSASRHSDPDMKRSAKEGKVKEKRKGRISPLEGHADFADAAIMRQARSYVSAFDEKKSPTQQQQTRTGRATPSIDLQSPISDFSPLRAQAYVPDDRTRKSHSRSPPADASRDTTKPKVKSPRSDQSRMHKELQRRAARAQAHSSTVPVVTDTPHPPHPKTDAPLPPLPLFSNTSEPHPGKPWHPVAFNNPDHFRSHSALANYPGAPNYPRTVPSPTPSSHGFRYGTLNSPSYSIRQRATPSPIPLANPSYTSNTAFATTIDFRNLPADVVKGVAPPPPHIATLIEPSYADGYNELRGASGLYTPAATSEGSGKRDSEAEDFVRFKRKMEASGDRDSLANGEDYQPQPREKWDKAEEYENEQHRLSQAMTGLGVEMPVAGIAGAGEIPNVPNVPETWKDGGACEEALKAWKGKEREVGQSGRERMIRAGQSERMENQRVPGGRVSGRPNGSGRMGSLVKRVPLLQEENAWLQRQRAMVVDQGRGVDGGAGGRRLI